MEKKYIVRNNMRSERGEIFTSYPIAVMSAVQHESATIYDADNGTILYVTYQMGDTRMFITTVNGELRVKETNS